MAYKVSGEKKAEWKKKAIENQNAARELILSVSRSYVEDPDKIAEVLQFASNFYQYSLHNMQLIYAQNRFARFVQSFDAWKKMDAHVQKGEKGMKIWVPVKVTILHLSDGNKIPLSDATAEQKKAFYNGQIEGEKRLRFKIGTVFDIGQTDFPKERYPEIYSMGYRSEEHAQIAEGLIKFSRSQGCPVSTKNLSSIAGKGLYDPAGNRIVLNELLEDTQKLSTLSQEIGHMLEQHGTRDISTAQKEFEADCISVLIQSHYGIELADSRKSHLAAHYKKFEQEMSSLDEDGRIKKTEDVLDASMKIFRQYVEQMDSYVKTEIEKLPVALTLDNKPILSFSYEVNECQEFPSMGNTYNNIPTAKAALEKYESIPEDRKMLIGGVNIVGKSSSGDEVEIIPISSGKYIDLDPLRCYPVLKANLQAEKMVKEFVDEAKKSGFQTFGKYDFSNTEAATLGNRRRRAM